MATVTIPDSLYVGIRNSTCPDMPGPLAFVTPITADAGFESRKNTVDSWTGKDGIFDRFDNTPRTGFSVVTSRRRSSRWSSNVVWRILDPKGFMLEISSENLEDILNNTTVKNGQIEEACIYGRAHQGGKIVLISVNSESYKEASKLTTISKKTKLPIKDLTIGDKFVMSDGTTGIYIGQHWMLKRETESDPQSVRTWQTGHRGDVEHFGKIYPRHFYIQTAKGYTSIECKARLNFVEILKQGCDISSKNTSNFTSHYGVLGITPFKVTPDNVKISLEPISIEECLNSSSIDSYDEYFVFKDVGGRYTHLRHWKNNRWNVVGTITQSTHFTFQPIDVSRLDENVIIVPDRYEYTSKNSVDHDVEGKLKTGEMFRLVHYITNPKTGKVYKFEKLKASAGNFFLDDV